MRGEIPERASNIELASNAPSSLRGKSRYGNWPAQPGSPAANCLKMSPGHSCCKQLRAGSGLLCEGDLEALLGLSEPPPLRLGAESETRSLSRDARDRRRLPWSGARPSWESGNRRPWLAALVFNASETLNERSRSFHHLRRIEGSTGHPGGVTDTGAGDILASSGSSEKLESSGASNL